MADTTVTVSDPDLVETKSVDGSGRVYLGKSFASGDVRLVVERIESEAEESEVESNEINPTDPIFERTTFAAGEPHDTSERIDEFVANAAHEDSHGEGS